MCVDENQPCQNCAKLSYSMNSTTIDFSFILRIFKMYFQTFHPIKVSPQTATVVQLETHLLVVGEVIGLNPGLTLRHNKRR